jgi:hypothetical protein
MNEQDEQEVQEHLPEASNTEVIVSLVLSFRDEGTEDGKSKFVATFYANAARYMEIEADQIHLTDRMKAIMREIIKVGTNPPKKCGGECKCKGGNDVKDS